MKKICSKCRESKELDKFHKDKKCKFGVRPECKICAKEYHRSFDGLILQMYRDMRQGIKRNRVKSKQILLRENFINLANNDSKLKLLYEYWAKHNYIMKLTLSVDRINNKLGYVNTNIQFLIQSENARKGEVEKNKIREENGNYKFPTKDKKWCNFCLRFLDKMLFYKNKSSKNGLDTYCKQCKVFYNKLRINN